MNKISLKFYVFDRGKSYSIKIFPLDMYLCSCYKETIVDRREWPRTKFGFQRRMNRRFGVIG